MNKRNTGIDLLRVVSMFMIVVLHVIGQGGFMVRNSAHPQPYYVVWFLETMAYCAVNCFGLISGYVGIKSRFKLSRLLELYLTVLFYTLLITGIAALVHPEWIDRDLLLKSFLPVQWKTYWYFSGYVAAALLSPFLNRMVLSLKDKERRRLLVVLLLVFSAGTFISKSYDVDFLQLVGGYSCMWLLVLYVCGACLGLEKIPGRKWLYGGIYLLCVVLSWSSKILIENHTRAVYGKAMHGRLLTTYTAPTIVMCGICLLLLFAGLQIRSRRADRLIRLVSGLSFSVYLIHTHPVIWDHVLKDAFRRFSNISAWIVWIPVLLGAAGIFLACLAADYLRSRLFGLIGVRRRLSFIDSLWSD